jgi:16S rRNA (adenine1518-N6/adenine1519-N6)-dimethyltransferase
VISNLPYYITAPILFHLFSFHSSISLAVLTMQKEVAARLLASPGTKDYGRLTLAVRYYADVKHAFDISPGCFTPKPGVDSSVVLLKFHPPSKLPKGVDEDFLFHLIQTAFSQRRKTLLHLLLKDNQIKISRDGLAAIFLKLAFPATIRGEELLLKDFMALAQALAPGKR